MPCCGQQRDRSAEKTRTKTGFDNTGAAARQPQQAAPTAVYFEYTGTRSLTAVGPVTNKVYRFAGPHARVVVDSRDSAGLSAIPQLRRL
jgi:hypothetical protein